MELLSSPKEMKPSTILAFSEVSGLHNCAHICSWCSVLQNSSCHRLKRILTLESRSTNKFQGEFTLRAFQKRSGRTWWWCQVLADPQQTDNLGIQPSIARGQEQQFILISNVFVF